MRPSTGYIGKIMKKVRKNSKLYKAVLTQAKRAVSYTLDNCFRGEEVENMDRFNKAGQDELDGKRVLTPKVWDNGDGTYTQRYHSKHWLKVWI